MPLYIKNSSNWAEPSLVYVKTGGVWAPADVYVKQAGVWSKVYPTAGTQNYASAGTYSFTVPKGVRSLTIDQSGGSGAGGGGASGAGSDGQKGFRDIRTVNVTPGEVLTIKVGDKGTGGRDGTADCGSNGGNWTAINNDPSSRQGLGATVGYAAGGDGSGVSCPYSFTSTGGWAGGGGASSAVIGSFGAVIAGGGSGGPGGINYFGQSGGGGLGGNNGVGNQGATGVIAGTGDPAQFDVGYGANGYVGYVNLSW